jgi:tRNA(fMet)-specific endonuclease VapC
MRLCLDTNVIVEIFRGRQRQFRDRLGEIATAGHELHLSALVLHELIVGAKISSVPERELNLIDGFVSRATVWPWTAEDAVVAASIRADLAKSGTPIGVVDALIAGQALNNGWAIVTANIREFIRVDGLTLIDWSDPAGAREIDRTSWRLAAFRNLKEPK